MIFLCTAEQEVGSKPDIVEDRTTDSIIIISLPFEVMKQAVLIMRRGHYCQANLRATFQTCGLRFVASSEYDYSTTAMFMTARVSCHTPIILDLGGAETTKSRQTKSQDLE